MGKQKKNKENKGARKQVAENETILVAEKRDGELAYHASEIAVSEDFRLDGSNYYLTELGVEKDDQVFMFAKKNPEDPRREIWELQRMVFGQDETELWSLDDTFYQWLYCHLRMFQDVGARKDDDTIVRWKGKDITLDEAMTKIVKWLGYAILHKYGTLQERAKSTKKAYKATLLWAKIMPYMWY